MIMIKITITNVVIFEKSKEQKRLLTIESGHQRITFNQKYKNKKIKISQTYGKQKTKTKLAYLS